jgi:cytochrome c oxidase cbb3-type subunit 3
MRRATMIQAVAVLCAGAGLLALGATEVRPQSAAPKVMTAKLIREQRVFLQYCAMCHGNGGEGDGEMASMIFARAGVRVANLTDRAKIERIGRSGVLRTVSLGGGHTGRSNLMPPWGDRLTARELNDVVDYVVQLPQLGGSISSWTLASYFEAPPGSPADGRAIFVHQCSACHGLTAHGDGPLAASLIANRNVHPRNLTDSSYVSTRTDRELFAVITEGGGAMGRSTFMPHWGGYLTSEQIKDLVSYVRTISHTRSQP